MARSEHEDSAVVGLLTATPASQVEQIRAWGLPPAVLLLLMNACENRCFFCANDGVVRPPPEAQTGWAAIEAHLEAARSLGMSTVCIVGTEPALHPDFERTLTLARAVGFARVELMTSGLRLAEPGVAQRWFAAGIVSVAVPMYGASAVVHDGVVGTVSFNRTLLALDQAKAAGIQVQVHTLALTRTLAALPALAALVQQRWGCRLAIAPVRPKESLFDYPSEAPSYAQLERAITGLDLSLTGFPDCVAPAAARGAALVIQLYFRGQSTSFLPVCEDCTRRPVCPGVVVAERGRAKVKVR
jgi:hypothetical protein